MTYDNKKPKYDDVDDVYDDQEVEIIEEENND